MINEIEGFDTIIIELYNSLSKEGNTNNTLDQLNKSVKVNKVKTNTDITSEISEVINKSIIVILDKPAGPQGAYQNVGLYNFENEIENLSNYLNDDDNGYLFEYLPTPLYLL